MEASTSDDAKDRRQGVGRGGIAMCFHPRLHPVILDKGSQAPLPEIEFNGLELKY